MIMWQTFKNCIQMTYFPAMGKKSIHVLYILWKLQFFSLWLNYETMLYAERKKPITNIYIYSWLWKYFLHYKWINLKGAFSEILCRKRNKKYDALNILSFILHPLFFLFQKENSIKIPFHGIFNIEKSWETFN